ncbi:MAG: ferric reductase-like transmembrane domain-containing protein, partial [Albidovulum sp.]
ATRISGVESVFGGLDRVYVLHKWAGIFAMLAILLHDTIDADMRGLGTETVLNDLAETVGEVSLYGLLILVVISVATFIPYHLWKWTHKAMGAFFVAGTFHFAFILKPFAMSDPAGLYTGLFCVAGVISYLWTLLPDRMRMSRKYEISAIDDIGETTAITMRPVGKGLAPKPGQFGVFQFAGATTAEPHPFSFSRIEADNTLRITVKKLGDFTRHLGRSIAVGQAVRVQGPFGRFHLRGTGPQVWIAGGIGITPFLTWAEALDAEADHVDMLYCARSKNDAPHLSEIEAIAAAKPNLSLHVMLSSEGQRISGDGVAETVGSNLTNAKIAFCGPLSLRQSLQSSLRTHGVTPRNFHYEEFEFRTGVGLNSLAKWIAAQTVLKAARVKASRSHK